MKMGKQKLKQEKNMDIKTFILVNKEVIEKLAIKKEEEKVVKKDDDWYNEDCWDNFHKLVGDEIKISNLK